MEPRMDDGMAAASGVQMEAGYKLGKTYTLERERELGRERHSEEASQRAVM